jgi:hypothetical protein
MDIERGGGICYIWAAFLQVEAEWTLIDRAATPRLFFSGSHEGFCTWLAILLVFLGQDLQS